MNDAFSLVMARINKFRPNDSGSIAVKTFTCDDDDIVLGVEIHERHREGGRPDLKEIWEFRCHDVRHSKLVPEHRAYPSVVDRHPLLLTVTEPHVELYFKGNCPDADRAVGQLLQAHREFVGDWFEFMHFINISARSSLSEFLRGEYGMLAAGPQSLMEQYAQVLRRNGFEVSSPPSTPPGRMKRGIWLAEDKPMQVLLIGNCYIVTSQITAVRRV